MKAQSYLYIKMVCMVMLSVGGSLCLYKTYQLLDRANVASSQLMDCVVTDETGKHGNPACLQSQVLAITGSVRATMGAVAKAAPDIATSIRRASANSALASQATIDVAQSATELMAHANGAVVELQATLGDLHKAVADLSTDSHALLASSDSAVRGLSSNAALVLDRLATLEVTLDKQINDGAPEAKRTLEAMTKLLEDPAITKLLEHADGIAVNAERGTTALANTAETIDIATRDLRQKAGRVKWVIERVLSMVKVTVPIF